MIIFSDQPLIFFYTYSEKKSQKSKAHKKSFPHDENIADFFGYLLYFGINPLKPYVNIYVLYI